jgi:hypothetical protein
VSANRADSVDGMPGVLVLITGTGRSGTSTMSGTFHHLGLHVPGPYLGSNESNPKGFFESRWAVRFHKGLIERAGIHEFDSRPDALQQVRAVLGAEDRAELAAFLAEQTAADDQVVVKDPRTVWVQQLWREVAAEQGLEIRYVSMLRHPAEVVGSRTTYYARTPDSSPEAAERERRRYAIFNVARWVNGSLVNERETRGQVRAFVRYTDLLEDWRPVLARLRDELGLRFELSAEHHPVDDFIDPALRRHTVTWEELDVPADLRDVAQGVWDAMQPLADHGGADADASARLDELATRYERLLADAAAIDLDTREGAVAAARRRGRAEGCAAAGAGSVDDRPVRDVGARHLLRVLARRASSRMRRSGDARL